MGTLYHTRYSKRKSHLVGLEHKIHQVGLGFLVSSSHRLQYQSVANEVGRVAHPLPCTKPATEGIHGLLLTQMKGGLGRIWALFPDNLTAY